MDSVMVLGMQMVRLSQLLVSRWLCQVILLLLLLLLRCGFGAGALRCLGGFVVRLERGKRSRGRVSGRLEAAVEFLLSPWDSLVVVVVGSR